MNGKVSLKVFELSSDLSSMSVTAPRFLFDSATGTYIQISSGLVLGRSQCSVFAADLRMSREHLQFLLRGETLFVVDLFSSNGVRLNGHAIPQGVRIPVKPRDTLSFGSQNLVVMASALEELGFDLPPHWDTDPTSPSC